MKLMSSKDFLDLYIPILKNKIDKELTLVIINTVKSEENKVYINSKLKLANKLGIRIIVEELYDVNTNELVSIIEKYNKDVNITGIIVQLPLADNLDEDIVLDSISPSKDVDGLTSENIGKLVKNSSGIVPATARGIIDLLDYYKIDVKGKNIVVIGKSIVFGKPISNLLINRGGTVTICHSKTKNIDFYTKKNMELNFFNSVFLSGVN